MGDTLAMKRFWIPALLALTIAIFVSTASGMGVCVGSFVGLGIVCIAIVGAISGFRQHSQQKKQTPEDVTRPSSRSVILACLSAGFVLIGYLLMSLTVLGNAREFGKSTVTTGNLRTIASGLRLYVESQGDYPPTFVELVSSQFEGSWDNFWSAGAVWKTHAYPEERESGPIHGGYTDFVYQPGRGAWRTDPELILAYDREPWTILESRLFPRYGRFVLFADNETRRLSEEEFKAARAVDRAMRERIGWPIPENQNP